MPVDVQEIRQLVAEKSELVNRLLASPRFQSWASRFPLTAPIARRDGAALFDVVAGFVHSQALFALVELRVLHLLVDTILFYWIANRWYPGWGWHPG